MKVTSQGGMPIWLLVAMVDDDPDEGHFNFNDELAAAEHGSKVIAGDGWSTVLDVLISPQRLISLPAPERGPLPLRTVRQGLLASQLKGSAISGDSG